MLRMKPWKAEDGSAYFGGWARMALPLQAFSVVEVSMDQIFSYYLLTADSYFLLALLIV